MEWPPVIVTQLGSTSPPLLNTGGCPMDWSLFIDTQLGSLSLLNSGWFSVDRIFFTDTQLGSGDPARFTLRKVNPQ